MPDKPLLLATREATPRMLEKMAASWDVAFFEDHPDLAAFIAARGPEVRGLMPKSHLHIDDAFMGQFPNLGIISNFGVGYDSIDASAAAKRGIIVSHTPDVLNDEVANTAIMLFLGVHREIVAHDAYLRAGRWQSEGAAPLTRGIAGQKVGILGMGRIGQAIAQKLSVFDVDVLYHTRSQKDVPYAYVDTLVGLANAVDTMIVITPGGPSTDKIVNADVLDALGPRGCLINIARGSVVDEPALVEALISGRLGSAGLDVFAEEPNVPAELIDLENVILLPHVGSATRETRIAMGDLVCENLDSWLRTGKAIKPVPECAGL